MYFNGELSSPFSINRSIKQGGILSMLNLCVYLHDFHNVVDPENKYDLSCGDLYIGSPCFADDVMLMSGSKHGLNNMMELAYDFSMKWRFTFSTSKSKCMVFGES